MINKFQNNYFLLALLILILFSCHHKKEAIIVKQKDYAKIKAVMDAHVKSLMSIDGVVGVAIGALDDSSLCIKVLVKKDNPTLRKEIPHQIENCPVVIEETGEIRAFPSKK
jgi:hypothetical protein